MPVWSDPNLHQTEHSGARFDDADDSLSGGDVAAHRPVPERLLHRVQACDLESRSVSTLSA